MDESVQAQIDGYVPHLNSLIRRGRELCGTLAADPSGSAALASTRIWQRDCVAAVNQLSGGSKAHWLSRAYSQAFLMRSTADRVVDEATIGEIVNRLVDVLVQGVASLTQMGQGGPASGSSEAPSPRRFEFVHNPELRPVVEQAYSDGRRALEQGQYGPALLTFCGILEAIVTDALEHTGLGRLAANDTPAGTTAGWSFEVRLAAAERAGLIRGGCARLPAVARRYRDCPSAAGEPAPDVKVSEREARVAGQVLHVVMRDLDPGR
jgi:hypothetical protein